MVVPYVNAVEDNTEVPIDQNAVDIKREGRIVCCEKGKW